MRDGTVILWAIDEERRRGLRGFVSRAITFFTESDYTHVALVVGGRMYESTVWKEDGRWYTGARESAPAMKADKYMGMGRDLTLDESSLLRAYCTYTSRMRRPYNVAKLLSLMIVYPTRWFWRRIGWVPFNREMQGDVCSGYVDEAFRFAGIDLLPGEHEGYTVPGDFTWSPLLRDMEV